MIACKTLLPIQEIDIQIDEIVADLEQKKQRLLKGRATVEANGNLIEKKEALKDKIALRVKKLELEMESFNEKKKSNKYKLSKAGLAPNIYVAIEKEIEGYKENIDKLETGILENLEKIEKLDEDLAQSNEVLNKQKGQLKTLEERYSIDKKEGLAKKNELTDSRRIASLDIETPLLEKYESLRDSKKGAVVFGVDDPGCPKCGMGFSSAFLNLIKNNEECGNCPNCGVFVFWIGPRE